MEIKDRVKAISEKLSYNQGYLGPGKYRWGYHAKKHVMAKNGKIRLDDMSAFLQRGVSKDKMISLLEDEKSRMRLVYLSCNHFNEDGGTPQEIMCAELNLTEEEAECLYSALDEAQLDYREAITRISEQDGGDAHVGRVKITNEMFDFAKLYAHSRIPAADNVLQDTKLLRATCNKIEEIDSEIVDEETRKQMKRELIKFLVKTTEMRKGVISKTLLNYECSKVFFRWGVVVHHNYNEWTEEAIAMSILWSKSSKVKKCGEVMADLLFPLSCHDMQPESLIISTVDRFEAMVDSIEEDGVAPSIAMAYEFLKMEVHTEHYLFKTLLRLSTSVGRRNEKRRRKGKGKEKNAKG